MDAAYERVIFLFLSFVSNHWRKFLFPAIAITIVAVFLLNPRGQAIDSEQPLFPELIEEEQEDEVIEEMIAPTILIVDVKGAVVHPGVYTLEEGNRLIDAIEAAGGYAKEADTRMLNHAMKVVDEMLVYVPKVGEELLEEAETLIVTSATGQSSSTSGSVVNINTADESQLMTISGIGPSKAAAIIEYRNEHGAFSAPESLMEVTGIGKKTFEKLKDNIIVK